MEEDKHLIYFDREVLSYYRTNSHAYELEEDDMGGEITVSDQWNESMKTDHPYISMKFGFKKLVSGKICVAAFGPTLKDSIPENDHSKWNGFNIDNPKFHEDNEPFKRWIKRNIYASPFVDDGPKIRIEKELKLINAITKFYFKTKLFKHEKYKLLNYPVAENSEEYTKAILELYRLIIDSMLKGCLEAIATKKSIVLTDAKKRLNSLKELLPTDLIAKIHAPIKKIDASRQPIHGIPSQGVIPFSAFDTFHCDLVNISIAFSEIKLWLEDEFDVTAESCLEYLDSLEFFPRIVKPPRPKFKLDQAKKMVGKTICKIEFGEREFQEDLHSSEIMNLHFSDGSVVNLRIGSNVSNISGKCKELNASDFSTDIMLSWANRVVNKNKK